MSTSKDRPNHPELFGLSFEQLLLKADQHLRNLREDFQGPDGIVVTEEGERLRECLDEMLWRQRREIEPR